jgi:hypothetical protein
MPPSERRLRQRTPDYQTLTMKYHHRFCGPFVTKRLVFGRPVALGIRVIPPPLLRGGALMPYHACFFMIRRGDCNR